ncbi:MAG: ABC transporter ATP-binding protein [Endomicrobia bacterium]|nr:ABC transporter ATP-binding protein [Endomicrobiia bacterium]MCL2799672.1 ABC transporter ATP-binding protein [Endomicrobiia bacterium]
MIKVQGLCKQFGLKRVLRDVNLEVKDGETIVIIGQSGTGKSILLKNIVGLIKPTSGSIFIDNVDITKCSKTELRESQKKMGYVFQESALFDSLTIEENVAFGLRTLTDLDEDEIKKRVMQCLDMVGLKNVEGLKPSELSGGMKKRAGLARAIAYQPKNIFYDEPTTGLDPIMTDVISDLIISLRKHLKITSIVVTHDMKSAYKIADRIIMLYKGEVVFNGTPEETRRTDNAVVRQFVEGSSRGPIETDRTFREME